LDELFYIGGLKADLKTQESIKNLSDEFKPNKASSLKHYLLKFLFAHKFNDANPLYEIIKEKVGDIYTIANLRNLGSHGQTSNERQMRSLSNEEIETYFDVIKQFVNNYITCYYV